MKTVQQEWESFAKAIFRGQEISEIQFTETKKAFFAGATAMLSMVQSVGDDGVTDEDGVAYLDALHDEILAFMQNFVDARRN